MFNIAVGHSNDIDSDDAIAEVLTQCQRGLTGQHPQAGLLLSAIDFDHESILHTIHQRFPGLELIGGTTDGEMSSVLGFAEDSLTLMLFESDRIEIRAGLGPQVSHDIPSATQTAVNQVRSRHQQPIRLCLTLPESLTTSGAQILHSLKTTLGADVPIFGGLTADQWRFKQTYQFCGTQVYSDAVPILTFAGPLAFSFGVASGWHPVGQKGTVTQVDHNVVYQINHEPAIAFYHYYLGDRDPSSEYPLAVLDPASDSYYMRAPSGKVDPETGAIYLFGDVPNAATIQITEATRDDILQASEASMRQALTTYPRDRTPSAALFFSCASRRQILGSRTIEEYQLAQACLQNTIPCCGFYTNGEIAPLNHHGDTHFHNETFITLLLGED